MFLPKNERGEFPMDLNEPPANTHELERAAHYLEKWHAAHRKPGQPPAGRCPHEDYPCESVRECIGKIAWWRRYVLEIEAAS